MHTTSVRQSDTISYLNNYNQHHSSVIGLQYGDEGKGQLVDILAGQHDLVVRYNGGANAGHSVVIGNEKYVLHQVPIGCLTPGRFNILGNGVVVSASALLQEITQLASAGVDLKHLKISERAHLVMPYHLIEERLRHDLTIQNRGEDHVLGTTQKGMGPCYADKASRDTGIRICDLYDRPSLKDKLKFILLFKNTTLAALAKRNNSPFEPFSLDTILADCEVWAKALAPYIVNTAQLLNQMESDGKTILFEGANAANLDLDFGTYPFVTSSNGSNLGIASGSGLLPMALHNRYGVAKTYMSRVGTGPFVTEVHHTQAQFIREIGAEYGSTTERPRRIGWLDIPALKEMVKLNKINKLVLTGLSILSQLDDFKICTKYQIDSITTTSLPASIIELQKVEPIYQHFVVDSPILDAGPNQNNTLSSWAQSLVDLIEAEVCPVAAICTGKRRNQIIWL